MSGRVTCQKKPGAFVKNVLNCESAKAVRAAKLGDSLLDATKHSFKTLQIGFIVEGGRKSNPGSERYYFDLLRELPKLGIENRGLVVGKPEAIEDPVAGVESIAQIGESAGVRVRNLRSAVRRLHGSADVISAHSPAHTWPVLDIIRRQPLVVHFHGPLVLEGRAEGKTRTQISKSAFAERLTFWRAKRFVVLSNANAATLREEYRVPEERIRVVPGAVDLARFAPTMSRREAREKLSWQLDRPVVVSVRRLAATKGLDRLIVAAGLLRQAVPDVVVMLVGSGPLRPALEAQVEAAGLQDTVRFAGQMSETLPLAYRAADVSVVPSDALEGFGLSVVESLACGTPAMVTPVTGLPEVVRDLDPALIFASSSAEAIADGLSSALLGRIQLPTEDACLSYVQRFAWPTIARKIAQVYQEVL